MLSTVKHNSTQLLIIRLTECLNEQSIRLQTQTLYVNAEDETYLTRWPSSASV